MRLKDKVAIITAAGSGMGREGAILFAREGAKVAVVDIDPKGGEETVKTITENGGDAFFKQLDVTDLPNLKKLIEPIAEKRPVFMALGNHDNRDNFVKVFDNVPGEKQPVKGKHVVVANKPPARLIILDSLLYVNKTPGLLGKAQRQWLQNYLTECDDTPTILCFHHSLEDGDGDLLDLPRLLSAMKPIRKVKAIVYGHSHVYKFTQYEGIHLINLPAIGYNFNDSDPVGWVEASLTAKGGDFKLHAIAGNTSNDQSVTKLKWRT